MTSGLFFRAQKVAELAIAGDGLTTAAGIAGFAWAVAVGSFLVNWASSQREAATDEAARRELAARNHYPRRYEEAEVLFRSALGGMEKALGRQHPQTRHVRRCLWSLPKRMGTENWSQRTARA